MSEIEVGRLILGEGNVIVHILSEVNMIVHILSEMDGDVWSTAGFARVGSLRVDAHFDCV